MYVCMYVYICMYVCMYIYVCDPKTCLNGSLAVGSPFQTLAIDFSSNL